MPPVSDLPVEGKIVEGWKWEGEGGRKGEFFYRNYGISVAVHPQGSVLVVDTFLMLTFQLF